MTQPASIEPPPLAPRPTAVIAIRDKKLGDWLYEQILERILRGDYPPQSRLPSEADLAAEFNVSRPVVRQALARLRDDDLVASRQGSGSWVKRRPDEAVLRFAPLAGLNDIQRCFEFRASFEGRAAGLAAARHDAAQLGAIRTAFAELERVVTTGSLGVEADLGFHLAVAEASGNHYFAETIRLLREHIDIGMNITRNLSLRHQQPRLRLVQDEHRRVLEAIAAGDAAGAEQAMLRHIDNARRRMFDGEAGGEGS
jgi:DNA-binding FadR family transcriptional regulator